MQGRMPRAACGNRAAGRHGRTAATQPARRTAKGKVEDLRKQLSDTVDKLEFDPTVHIEIRFKELKYEEVIWPLQQDPLVDRLRTPQTRASIRIVIGTLDELRIKTQ